MSCACLILELSQLVANEPSCRQSAGRAWRSITPAKLQPIAAPLVDHLAGSVSDHPHCQSQHCPVGKPPASSKQRPCCMTSLGSSAAMNAYCPAAVLVRSRAWHMLWRHQSALSKQTMARTGKCRSQICAANLQADVKVVGDPNYVKVLQGVVGEALHGLVVQEGHHQLLLPLHLHCCCECALPCIQVCL